MKRFWFEKSGYRGFVEKIGEWGDSFVGNGKEERDRKKKNKREE